MQGMVRLCCNADQRMYYRVSMYHNDRSKIDKTSIEIE